MPRTINVDLMTYISLTDPARSEAIAAYLTEREAQRTPPAGWPPVTAPPVRRCEGCQTRSWEWREPHAGAGRWVCGTCQG